MKKNELKGILIREIPIGRKNSVMSKYLEEVAGVKGSTIRDAISDLRAEGVPICSCANGYFWAESETDVKQTVAMLNHRCYKMIRASKGMEKGYAKKVCKEAEETMSMDDGNT